MKQTLQNKMINGKNKETMGGQRPGQRANMANSRTAWQRSFLIYILEGVK